MEAALRLIPAKHVLLLMEGAGHDLGFKGKSADEKVPKAVVDAFTQLLAEI
jgi:hypothetical protein